MKTGGLHLLSRFLAQSMTFKYSRCLPGRPGREGRQKENSDESSLCFGWMCVCILFKCGIDVVWLVLVFHNDSQVLSQLPWKGSLHFLMLGCSSPSKETDVAWVTVLVFSQHNSHERISHGEVEGLTL